jgi:hypothetical protein
VKSSSTTTGEQLLMKVIVSPRMWKVHPQLQESSYWWKSRRMWKVHPQLQESSCWWKSSCHEEYEKFIHNNRRASADERHLLVRLWTGHPQLLENSFWVRWKVRVGLWIRKLKKTAGDDRLAACREEFIHSYRRTGSSTATGEQLVIKGTLSRGLWTVHILQQNSWW